MHDFRFSVVIPTYNRSQLVGRAVRSVLEQNWPDFEVVVVDDASTDNTGDMLRDSFPEVRYFCQSSNRGQCEARNRGILEASRPWLVFLDDDDALLPGALDRIATQIGTLRCSERYPAFQFTYASTKMADPFVLVGLEHYIGGLLQGEFLPVINRERFVTGNLAYPESRHPGERIRSGEHLLWWRVAEEYGIPTWHDPVAMIHTDASGRNTSASYQIAHAGDFARLHERTLLEFGEVLLERFPAYYEQRRLSAAIYWMLAREGTMARAHLRKSVSWPSGVAFGLWVLSWAPARFTKLCYTAYRRRVSGWDA